MSVFGISCLGVANEIFLLTTDSPAFEVMMHAQKEDKDGGIKVGTKRGDADDNTVFNDVFAMTSVADMQCCDGGSSSDSDASADCTKTKGKRNRKLAVAERTVSKRTAAPKADEPPDAAAAAADGNGGDGGAGAGAGVEPDSKRKKKR